MMTIRNKLYVSAGVSVILLVLVIFVALRASEDAIEKDEERQIVHEFQLAISELDILTYDYLLHREKRMVQQWDTRYSSAAELLEEESGKLTEAIRADYAALGDLFSQVTANYEEQQKLVQEGAPLEEIGALGLLEERFVGQLLVRSQSILSDTDRLADATHTEAVEARERGMNLTIFLIIVLGIIVVTTSLLVARSISKPLAELTKGAEIIGGGNLRHRIAVKSRDEVGDLASSFNQMTKHLYSSRNELEKEIVQRKRAETKLRKRKDELERFAKLTVGREERMIELKKMIADLKKTTK